MQPFSQRVIAIVSIIPAGKVMTYGQVAAIAGQARGGRQVGRILHVCSERHRLPWHRVINSEWRVSFRGDEQRLRLEAEGVVFDVRGRVDPRRDLFTGPFPTV